MAKDLEICHSSLIKEIRKTQVNMIMVPSLLRKNMTLEFAKNHFKLKSKIYKFQDFEEKFLKIYNAKEIPVERTVEFIKRNYNIKCPSIKTIYNWINSKNWKINRKNLLRSNYVFGGKKQKSVQERLVRKRWVRPFKIAQRKNSATMKRI
ncbi:hypothetical protein [Mycoplasmopsis synoviae]|uniref:hypothetical protein n=1 Tax=Mycoplasmopsis synoviae TaxID=2109 RepID=UPI0006875C76|nr:hypothetical protein [Mycoplasmopsis synoviae]